MLNDSDPFPSAAHSSPCACLMSQAAVDTYAGISGDLQMIIADSGSVLWIWTASLMVSAATTPPAAADSSRAAPSVTPSCPG